MKIHSMTGKVISLAALAAAGGEAARSVASGIEMGHLRRFVRPGAHGGSYLDLDAAQAAGLELSGIAMGMHLAGAAAKLPAGVQAAIDGAVHPLFDQVNGLMNDMAGIKTTLAAIQSAVQNPSASSMVAARRAAARATNTPVLLDVEPDQRRLQHLPVTALLPSTTGVAGSTNVFGASQIILKPKRMIVGGASVINLAAQPYGLAGSVITQVFVGNKLQTTAVPGGGGGLPIEYFDKGAFDANFEYDTIGPAITVSLGIAWPAWWLGSAIPFNASITGDSAFS